MVKKRGSFPAQRQNFRAAPVKIEFPVEPEIFLLQYSAFARSTKTYAEI